MATYYIYILSNASDMLYVGLTLDLEKMVLKHRNQQMISFKGNFSFNKLVYVEETRDIHHAIRRELELKETSRHVKTDLVKMVNPDFECILG